MTSNKTLSADARRLRTITWIVVLATCGLIFDGYDLVVYGAVVSTFLRDSSHLGPVTPAVAGLLGSEQIGWRGLFWIGALPAVTLLPLAYFKMPESVAWLVSRGRLEEARQVSERTGVPLPEPAPVRVDAAVTADAGKVGFAGLFSAHYLFPTIVLGLMSATGLMLVYSLNTWLPEIMLRAGFNAKGSLSFLAVLNGGSLFGALAASRAADRFGPKPVVAACFAIGAVALVLLTMGFALAALLVVVAIVGLGTSGTQTLIYGFVANYYRTNVRAAGVAWCAGFGRLGGIGGPMLGSALIGANLQLNSIFYALAGLGLLGMALTLLVPMGRSQIAPVAPSAAGRAGNEIKPQPAA